MIPKPAAAADSFRRGARGDRVRQVVRETDLRKGDTARTFKARLTESR